MALTAAAPASALSYDNTDPQSTGCASSGITVKSASIRSSYTGKIIGSVELRWSTKCKTNWARVSRTDGASAEYMTATSSRSVNRISTSEHLRGYNSIWSNQVYGNGYVVCATGNIDQSFASGSATVCY
jgi:hypothetical protein